MIIATFLYDGFTMLDAVGPVEVLSMLPEVETRVLAKESGVVWPDNQAMPFVAPFGIADCDRIDVLLIPGGPGCLAITQDQTVLQWIARVHERTRFTCSVCTGSVILGAAGLLSGLPATSHWTTLSALEPLGATPVAKRWVQNGRIITAAGVSAGIDMALEVATQLAGEKAARAVQLALEYDPKPPLDSGDHQTASPEIRASLFDGTVAFDRRSRARPAMPDWQQTTLARER
jgi:transcriptional regulator GlxA family with amidase domain